MKPWKRKAGIDVNGDGRDVWDMPHNRTPYDYDDDDDVEKLVSNPKYIYTVM